MIGALRESAWIYPLVEVAHIAGFAVLVGAIAVLDLRVLGCSKRLPVDALARHVVPWTLGAFAVVLSSGLLLFAVEAADLVANRVFLLKLLLLAMAGANVLAFHAGPLRTVERWRTGVAAPALARAHAWLSLALWLSILGCGRFIAYV